jgi:hypothetical protein
MVDHSEFRIRATMRNMEWERVKGSLRAMLQTFYDSNECDEHERARHNIGAFIMAMDDGGRLEATR